MFVLLFFVVVLFCFCLGFVCLFVFCSFGFFWPCLLACRILVPQSGIEPGPRAVKAQSPNHWTTREFPYFALFLLLQRMWLSSFLVAEILQEFLGCIRRGGIKLKVYAHHFEQIMPNCLPKCCIYLYSFWQGQGFHLFHILFNI